MNVPRTWIKIIYLISLIAQIYSNIDSKEHFCGKKLVKTLTELCSIYNNPSFGRNRFRRQIVQECCRSQCSRRYLVQYYCLEANSSILNLLKTNPENSNKSGFDKDTKNYQADNIRTVAAEEKNSLTVGISQSDGKKTLVLKPKTVHSLSSSHNKTTRGKRNCKCRKRRAKKMKKSRQQQPARNGIHKPVPPPNIGHVENSQKPFYVWKFSRIF